MWQRSVVGGFDLKQESLPVGPVAASAPIYLPVTVDHRAAPAGLSRALLDFHARPTILVFRFDVCSIRLPCALYFLLLLLLLLLLFLLLILFLPVLILLILLYSIALHLME